MYLLFLGSGGGRAVTYTQERKTAGFYLDLGPKILVDPGLGSYLWYNLKFKKIFDIKKLSYVFVSHAHIDHANDLQAYIDFLTIGKKKRWKGALFASESVLYGVDGIGPSINKSYLNYINLVENFEDGKEFTIKGIKVSTIKNKHSDPTTHSIKWEINDKKIVYISDTAYFDELIEFSKDADILITNCLRPFGDKHSYHLTADDVLKLALEAKPKLLILHHQGLKFKNKEIETIKKFKFNTINTLFSYEGLKINIENLGIEYVLDKPNYYEDLIELYRKSYIDEIHKQAKRSSNIESRKEERIRKMLKELKEQFEDDSIEINQTWFDIKELNRKNR